MITWSLAADANLAAGSLGILDHLPDQREDGTIALIEQIGQKLAIAINTEGELGQIIRSDAKAIKTLGKLAGENHIGWNLAHDVDLEVRSTDKAFFGHGLNHLVGFGQGAAEWDHANEIRQAHGLPDHLDCLAFELETIAITGVVVTRGSAEANLQYARQIRFKQG